MSPRKTRRGAKVEASINDTLSETMSTKSLVETPEMKTNRSKRQATKKSATESDVDLSPEINKSKRRTTQTIQATPSKSTRSRKKVLLDNTVNDEPEPSMITSAKTRRTRRGKENETLVDQTICLDSTTKDDSISNVNKSQGTRARKKTAKKAETKSYDEEAVPTEEMNASAAINVTIINSTINANAAPMSDVDTEVLQVSSRISRQKAATATPASLLPTSRRSRSVKQRLEDFTPESSPITVNLTPHRTTKTPRKSPMNLGSPKSHADAPQRLSKTPRKLPVVGESPAPSEMSVNSSAQSTPEKFDQKLSISKKQHKIPKARKSPVKSPHRSHSKVVAVRKFSKSPKIVLRSPKPKSVKSKSPKLIASKVKRPSISKRSSKTSPIQIKTPVKSPDRKSPKSPRKSTGSPKKFGEPTSPRRSLKQSAESLGSSSLMSVQLARIDSPRSLRETKLFSSISKPRVSNVQSPTVILNKISSTNVATPETVTRTSLRKTPMDESFKSTPVKSASAEKRSSQGGESPRRAKSTGKKRAAITDSGTPLRPIDSPETSAAAKLAAGKSIILSSSNTPVYIETTKTSSGGVGSRMLSSTPRERIRRSLNLSPSLCLRSGILNSPPNGEVPVTSSTMIIEGRPKRRSFRIDDESNPLISEDESFNISPRAGISRLNGTFEVVDDKDATIVLEKEQENSLDGTYDLAEPKTPSLKRKAAKRNVGDLDTSGEERAVKRMCRVRFASPTSNEEDGKTNDIVIGRSRSATPGHRVVAKRTSQTPNGTNIFGGTATTPSGNTSENKSRRRSSSMTNVSLLNTPVGLKRRSNSVSDAVRSSIRKAQAASSNRLSKPRLSIPSTKKSEVKTPVARKAPNFAQIHQKKFAAMESLVDAKKRVEKRHIAISSKIPTNMTRVNLTVPTAIKLPTNIKVPTNIKIPAKIEVPAKPARTTQPIGPVVPVNNAYTRYGFKLRKHDATKIITQKKQPAINSQKKQIENRLMLKGVRTNRRFDLIMKARNINI